MRETIRTQESEKENQHNLKLLFKLIKKALGIKTPEIDMIFRVSDVANGDSTLGEAALDTALLCNGVTATLNTLSKLGRYSAENQFSKRLTDRSAQLIGATNPVHQRESAELWQAANTLRILEGVSYGLAEIKHFVIAQIDETLRLASQIIDISDVIKKALHKALESGKLSTNFHDANRKLFDAASRGDIAGIESAIRYGASIDAKDPCYFHHTALHHAADKGHVETVKYLIDHGASLTQTNVSNYTPRDQARILTSQGNVHAKRVHDFFNSQDTALFDKAPAPAVVAAKTPAMPATKFFKAIVNVLSLQSVVQRVPPAPAPAAKQVAAQHIDPCAEAIKRNQEMARAQQKREQEWKEQGQRRREAEKRRLESEAKSRALTESIRQQQERQAKEAMKRKAEMEKEHAYLRYREERNRQVYGQSPSGGTLFASSASANRSCPTGLFSANGKCVNIGISFGKK